MNKSQLYKTALMLGLVGTLGACQSHDIQPTQTSQSLSLSITTSTAGTVDSWQVPNAEQVLVVSEKIGLSLHQGDTRKSQQKGEFKQVRLSPISTHQWLYAALEASNDSVFIGTLNAETATLTPQFSLSQTGLLVDNLCLFADPANETLSIFLSDGRGRAEQWLLRQQQSWLATPLLLRELALPYDADSCAVDPNRGFLYVSEPLGIWRYPARIEDNPEYYPVSLVAPYGEQAEPASSLATSDSGELFALLESGDKLLYWDAPEKVDSWQPAKSYALTGLTATMLNLTHTANQHSVQLSFTSEETGHYGVTQVKLNSVAQSPKLKVVRPIAQSQPAEQFGDAMDDPAIWVHPTDPEQSRVLGTHKKQGLQVYDLQGNLLQKFEDGRLNNVDVRTGFNWQGRIISLVTASKRDDDSLAFYGIEADGQVRRLGTTPAQLTGIYGLCMATYQGKHYVFANNKDGLTLQYEVQANNSNLVAPVVRKIQLGSQPEGCVADDVHERLFIGEEDVGIWVTSLNPADNSQPHSIATVGTHLVDDVEGLALSHSASPILIVSSQGNNSYQLYQATPPYNHLAGFRVGLDGFNGIDGSSETDGLALSTTLRSKDYPNGLLVIQDGRNRLPDEPQNFKYVSWQDVLNVTGLATTKLTQTD
ncbi:phytase [Pseudoalteromonas sp. SMS1]|uniref:phytase n=1 Tax=Pseudoalteromonas sp. SMS1 TaxID=2908894 RepID=UPI001F4441E0|nr:phytase [Pseudoalteromonas sp. SMS1]MCF2858497.1 phytase [Pseudoalteromonas sp. SMS1]